MRLKKQTIVHLASIVACGNLVLQALGFGYRILLSRFAGAEGLGVFHLVSALYQLLHSFCLAGVTSACSCMTTRLYASRKNTRLGALLRLSFVCFGCLFALSSLAVLGLRIPIAHDWLRDPRTLSAFPFLLACLLLTGIENIFKSFFNGLSQVQHSAVSEVGEQAIRILAAYLLLRHYSNGDHGRTALLIFLAMVISEVASALFLSTQFACTFPCSSLRTPAIDPSMRRDFFRIALPTLISALAVGGMGAAQTALLPQRLMRAGLTHAQALSALGIISGMAMPILLLPCALICAICGASFPAVTAAHTRRNLLRVRALIARTLTTAGLVGLPATALLIPLTPALCALLFSQTLTLRYAIWLGVAVVCSYYQMVTSGLLCALGMQHWSMVTSIAAEGVQLGLLYCLVAQPGLAMYGYLIAMIVAGAASAIANLVFLCRSTRTTLSPARCFGVPMLCALTLFLWTRLFGCWFFTYFSQPALALGCTLLGAGALYLAVMRLLGVRVFRYLSQRIEPSTAPPRIAML